MQKERMRVIKTSKEMVSVSSRFRQKGRSIGLVPTMGYLHEGHLSLIRKARRENDIVVVSIFVNPTQFGPKEDYKHYPRNQRQDKKKAREAGCDILFYPHTKDIYTDDHTTYVNVKGLSLLMCGTSRPTHFEGVTTICAKLFNVVNPDKAYFGQKDYQQAVIIMKMVADLNMNVRIRIAPIVREKNGLAMSSRNKYLSSSQRENSAILYQSLKLAKALIMAGERSSSNIKKIVQKAVLTMPGIDVEYVAIVDPATLKEKRKTDPDLLVALAARLGRARLIDNVLIKR